MHQNRWSEAHKYGHPNCKRCAKKPPGRGGGRVLDDAQMGTHLLRCGGRVNNHNAGDPTHEAGADRARTTFARTVTAG